MLTAIKLVSISKTFENFDKAPTDLDTGCKKHPWQACLKVSFWPSIVRKGFGALRMRRTTLDGSWHWGSLSGWHGWDSYMTYTATNCSFETTSRVRSQRWDCALCTIEQVGSQQGLGSFQGFLGEGCRKNKPKMTCDKPIFSNLLTKAAV